MSDNTFNFCETGYNLNMMPVGYLMIEHRLIERVIKLMSAELETINKNREPSLSFIDKTVDFIRNYADKCHHGKEEDILFKELSKRQISSLHRKMVAELISEHRQARDAVKDLMEARNNYVKNKQNSLSDIKRQIKWLIEFYPKHIEKEDKRFFIPSMSYFSKKEQDKMLSEFCRFDSNAFDKSVQDTYRKKVAKLERKER